MSAADEQSANLPRMFAEPPTIGVNIEQQQVRRHDPFRWFCDVCQSRLDRRQDGITIDCSSVKPATQRKHRMFALVGARPRVIVGVGGGGVIAHPISSVTSEVSALSLITLTGTELRSGSVALISLLPRGVRARRSRPARAPSSLRFGRVGDARC